MLCDHRTRNQINNEYLALTSLTLSMFLDQAAFIHGRRIEKTTFFFTNASQTAKRQYVFCKKKKISIHFSRLKQLILNQLYANGLPRVCVSSQFSLFTQTQIIEHPYFQKKSNSVNFTNNHTNNIYEKYYACYITRFVFKNSLM